VIPELSILAAAVITPDETSEGPSRVARLEAPARFSKGVLRRTSRLGRLALPVVEQALTASKVPVDASLGLVVGTGLADLDETLGFLDGLHTRGERFASPQMFQRSVHSAVAGELAILYGLEGFNLTVTQGLASGEAALFSAALAVAAGRCARCLCVAVDGVSDGLLEALAALGIAPEAAGEGAAALVLARDDDDFGPGLARLLGVDVALAEEAHRAQAVPRGAHGALGLVRTAEVVLGLPGARLPAGVRVAA